MSKVSRLVQLSNISATGKYVDSPMSSIICSSAVPRLPSFTSCKLLHTENMPVIVVTFPKSTPLKSICVRLLHLPNILFVLSTFEVSNPPRSMLVSLGIMPNMKSMFVTFEVSSPLRSILVSSD